MNTAWLYLARAAAAERSRDARRMATYVPPHIRKQQQQQQQQQQSGGRSLAELDQAAAASESARWGRAAALGGAGGSSRRWDSNSSNVRSREDRSYEYLLHNWSLVIAYQIHLS